MRSCTPAPARFVRGGALRVPSPDGVLEVPSALVGGVAMNHCWMSLSSKHPHALGAGIGCLMCEAKRRETRHHGSGAPAPPSRRER